MDDFLANFLKMRTKITLFIFLFFGPSGPAHSDELLKIMENYWSYEENVTQRQDCSCQNYSKNYEEEDYFSDESPGDYANGEHYSWDNIYLEPNYPEIIY